MEQNYDNGQSIQDEAYRRNIELDQIREEYNNLGSCFSIITMDDWATHLQEREKPKFKKKRDPSTIRVIYEVWRDRLRTFNLFGKGLTKEDKQKKKEEIRMKLQAQTDAENEIRKTEYLRNCAYYDQWLKDYIVPAFEGTNDDVISDYFTDALYQNRYNIEPDFGYPNFKLRYSGQTKSIIIDLNLPTIDQTPNIKCWAVNKNKQLESKKMSLSEHRSLYEKILFNLAFRTVGILFCSDSNCLVDSITFAGSYFFPHLQTPVFILSFEMKKNQFPYQEVGSMALNSKEIIGKLDDVRYIGSFKNVSSNLDQKSVKQSITPIRSNF